MKAQILKIAGVKSEKEFYKKYPTEAAFFKAHPEAKKSIKKAQTGLQTDANANGVPDYLEMNPPTQAYGPQNQWSFGNGWTPSSSPFNAPNAQQMAASTFQPAADPFAMQNYGQQWAQQNPLPQNDPNSRFSNGVFGGGGGNKKGKFDPTNMFGAISGIADSLKQIEGEKKWTKHLRTWADVMDVNKRAAISNAFVEKQPNEWYRPDDKRYIQSASMLGNTKGRGTDVLGQNGSDIGGNPTEIQNTYNDDYTLYTDLEDPNTTKVYQGGGSWLGQVNSGLTGSGDTSFLGNMGVQSPVNSIVGGAFGNSGGYNLGSNIGSLVGGPAGSLIGGFIGGIADKEQGKQAFAQGRINSDQSFMDRLSMAGDIHRRFSANTQNGGDIELYEEGGYMNPEYNPQVITMFGDVNAQDFADFAHKDQYRAGGHLKEYTPPSETAMETYALGGKLKGHWGGEVEDMSHNPYLPGSGMTAMIKGASHNDGGVGISYGGQAQNGYEYAANGAEMNADIEAEGGESVMEMAEGGNINSPEEQLKAVVVGNIPLSTKMANATGDEDLIRLAKDNNGASLKKIFAKRTLQEIKANKYKQKASDIANDADDSKYGQLYLSTAQIMDDAADKTLELIAKEKMKMVNYQDTLHKIKDEVSKARGKNISAEALGRGQIKDDLDPITKDAPLKSKNGFSLKKAQTGETVTTNSEGSRLTPEEYYDLVRLYNQGRDTAGGKSDAIKEFQRKYHQKFPKEAIAAIQNTTRKNGLSNKAKAMGLTVEDILSGKDPQKILESNEDTFWGPRTVQYMSDINADFNKTPAAPALKLASLNVPSVTTDTKTNKKQIGIVPYKENRVGDILGLVSNLFQRDNLHGIDPRQFAGEDIAMAQNTYQPVPTQHELIQLDPITRITYQDVRDASTADFREAEKQLSGNTAALTGLYAKKFASNQPGYAEEFRTNQALEDKIYGGNRAKVNQNMKDNIALNLDQANKQSLRDSISRQITQKAIASRADKELQHQALIDEYRVKRNLFPKFGFDSNYNIHTQGPWYKPTIPQIYGGKATIQEVPVYGADGKIQYYKMEEAGGNSQDVNTTTNTTTAPWQTPPYIQALEPLTGLVQKNGGSIKKNNRNSSIVKAYKNL